MTYIELDSRLLNEDGLPSATVIRYVDRGFGSLQNNGNILGNKIRAPKHFIRVVSTRY